MWSRIKSSQPLLKRFASSTSIATSTNLPSNASLAFATVASIGTVAAYSYIYGTPISANSPAELGLHSPQYAWPENGMLSTYDHQSLRRGYQVYREVCSACHSLDRIAWRNMVGVTHTVDETKVMAEEVEYEDGPDDNGEMFQRPGKLSDYMPRPYPNDEAARAGNAGALPPDLSLITKARHGGSDYVFALITGYVDPPAGLQLAEGMNFNPYFPGTGIAMARVLYDGLVEYEDGTPATTSQMAKDVVSFLHWAAEPELDERKKMGFQAVCILTVLYGMSIYMKRFKWAPIKSRKIVYNPPK